MAAGEKNQKFRFRRENGNREKKLRIITYKNGKGKKLISIEGGRGMIKVHNIYPLGSQGSQESGGGEVPCIIFCLIFFLFM